VEHATDDDRPRRSSRDEPSLRSTLLSDLRRMHIRRDYIEELRRLYLFYLDDERRAELARMSRVGRAFSMVGWLLKSLILKLSPARRLMLLAAFALSLVGVTQWGRATIDFRPSAFVLLLIVLMLELRDKLLVRDEIEIARQVQLALLPRHEPAIPGWEVWSYSRPANDVGGDLVDYIELGGFRHGIVLGDVAGKGLGAALLSAKLQATMRALVPEAPSLVDLGQRVNTILCRDGLENRYATLLFLEVEHDAGVLRYLNAGHNPPIVIHREGVSRLPASSFPLGMLSDATYEEGLLELAPGEWILAYSDGLTEATNAAEEEFGVERLEALIPRLRALAPEAAGRRVLKEVDRFVGELRPADDLSLVVIARHK
jgi:hypothetical protein